MIEIIKAILEHEIKIYKAWKAEYGKEFCYDEAWTLFTDLDRGQCDEILDILSQD